MISSFLLVYLSTLFISFVFGEAEIRFTGQTEFFVNETSTTVIRLVIERIGEPANVTAIVSVRSDHSHVFNQMHVTLFSLSRNTFNCLGIGV
jgi:G-protein coupled receptor 98